MHKLIQLKAYDAPKPAGLGVFLAVADGAEEAIAQVELGRQLDPLSVLSHGFASVSFAVLDRLEAAESAARQAFELQPDSLFEDVERGLSSGRFLCSLGESARPREQTYRLVRDRVIAGGTPAWRDHCQKVESRLMRAQPLPCGLTPARDWDG